MSEVTGGGRVSAVSPVKIVRSNNKYPILCQRCSGLFTVQDGGPDSGRIFTCGICVENMEQGTMAFSCSYFDASPVVMVEDKMFCNGTCMCQQEGGIVTCKKPIAPIIDAEELQRAIRVLRSIEEVPVKKGHPFGYFAGRF